MRIGFTGTQDGMNEKQLDALWVMLQNMEVTEFHHGDCIGADEQAHSVARRLGIDISLHPPELNNKRAFCVGCWASWMPKPYLDRNKDIVNATELLIAAPSSNTERLRSGTWATVRYARKLGKTIYILER